MTTIVPPGWAYSLEDSVSALGAAARELRHAHQQAALLVAGVDLQRIRIHGGKVDLQRTIARGTEHWRRREPHLMALSEIDDAYRAAEDTLNRRCEEAALAYAHGAAWAVRAVLAGDQPAHVVQPVTADGYLIVGPLPEIDLGYQFAAQQIEEVAAPLLHALVAADAVAHDRELPDQKDLNAAAAVAEAAIAYGDVVLRWLPSAVRTAASRSDLATAEEQR